MSIYHVLGLMSGTSLDGLDVALCKFNVNKKNNFHILHAQTFKYNNVLTKKLRNAHHLSALELGILHNEFACFMAERINLFFKKYKCKVDLIASHGHTVFHQPEKKITLQIGSGAVLAAETGVPVVCDFRSVDVALGGQGAPLVPQGDEDLFAAYDYCLNLGGIANVSYKEKKQRKAFDICPVNMALNYLANQKKLAYDKNGMLAAKGMVYNKLLNQLNKLHYYSLPAPKSLAREWFESTFKPLLDQSKISVEDKLATVCHHIAMQISAVCNKQGLMLVTGGGAHNLYLMEKIKSHFSGKVVVPDKIIVDYKEALVFAWLGLLRFLAKENIQKSYTGAKSNSISGAIYL
jgi:anhydro-N-acetylmuramic acid kinase